MICILSYFLSSSAKRIDIKQSEFIHKTINTFQFLGDMDIIPDDFFVGSLSIIVDVCVTALISDDRYKLAKQVVVIDHHLNQQKYDHKCHPLLI